MPLIYDIIFNPKKTKCICFSQKAISNIPKLKLNDDLLEWTQCVEHLGHYLTYNLNENYEIQMKQNVFIKSVNSVIVNCANLPRMLVRDIYLGRCHAFYGCQTWDITSPCLNMFNVTWRKATRRLLGLPGQTRSGILPILLGGLNFMDIICNRIIKLKGVLKLGHNKRLTYLCGLSTSITSRNIAFITDEYGEDDNIGAFVQCMNDEFRDRALMLDELVACRDGLMSLRGFSNEELNTLIYFVACDRH